MNWRKILLQNRLNFFLLKGGYKSKQIEIVNWPIYDHNGKV
jgi:hypothetical protein